jgi:autotransporter adhesin
MQQCVGTGGDSLCMGSGASASGSNTTSMGTNAQSMDGGTAIGAQTKVTGENGTAIGIGAKAGDPGTAVGAFADATGVDASAFGYNAKATGNKSVAIGTVTNAIFDNSTAIGAGAETTRANQVVIGAPGTSLTLKGVADKGNFVGKANQTGDTRLLTADGSGNIGTSSFSPEGINNSVSKLEQSVKGLGNAVTSAGAMAAAFTAVPQVALSRQEPMRCGVGMGSYGSSYARPWAVLRV